jgi:hypothetical protein
MMAIGVASPRAQGQATISTATPARMLLLGSPASHHPPTATSARAATTGTNTEAIRSARRWIGAFEPCALLDQCDHLRQRRLRAHRRRPHRQPPVRVHRGPDDLVARRLLCRNGLAGQHRLVDRRRTGEDETVGRHLLARADEEDVVHPQGLDGDQDARPG